MAEHAELYRRAEYYDVVFNRDVGRELDFARALFREANGRDPDSLIDIACGPGYHARRFARDGGRAYGLDLRPEMVAFAGDQARAEGVDVGWLAADMRDFRLPEPVDLAMTMFDSVDCLLTDEDVVAHLRAVAANLRPGGLYLIERAHPRDLSPTSYGFWRYQGQRDGRRVLYLWGVNRPTFDPTTNVAVVEVEIEVEDGDVRETFVVRAEERFLSAPELDTLAELSGALRVRRRYGAFDPGQPFDNTPASRQMLTLMERVG